MFDKVREEIRSEIEPLKNELDELKRLIENIAKKVELLEKTKVSVSEAVDFDALVSKYAMECETHLRNYVERALELMGKEDIAVDLWYMHFPIILKMDVNKYYKLGPDILVFVPLAVETPLPVRWDIDHRIVLSFEKSGRYLLLGAPVYLITNEFLHTPNTTTGFITDTNEQGSVYLIGIGYSDRSGIYLAIEEVQIWGGSSHR